MCRYPPSEGSYVYGKEISLGSALAFKPNEHNTTTRHRS